MKTPPTDYSYSLTVTLAYLPVTFHFDLQSWHQRFSHKWRPFITQKSAHHHIYIDTQNTTLETSITRWDSRHLFISCHPDRLMKHIFRTLNYGLKRLTASWLFQHHIYLIHCSGVIHADQAILFSGPVGAGKTTIVKLLTDFIPLTDDTIFLSFQNNQLTCYPSPFHDKKNYLKYPANIPLKHIFFLHHAPLHRLTPLDPQSRFRQVLSLFFLWYPQDPQFFHQVTQTARHLQSLLPLQNLYFNNDSSINQFISSNL